jgi:hypothetical protein
MLTIKSVEKLPLNSVEWDEGEGSVSGYGIRRRTGKTVVYVLKYCTLDGRQRGHTIGRHGAPWTPDMARDEARRLLGEVVKGDDPAAAKRAKRKAATVAEVCDAYLEAAEAGRILTRRGEAKRPSTLLTDKGASSALSNPCSAASRCPRSRAMMWKVSCTPSQRARRRPGSRPASTA